MHASGRPPAGTTADSCDPGGAAAGSRGGLEGSIEEEPVILVGESGSGRWNIGGCAVERGVRRRPISRQRGGREKISPSSRFPGGARRRRSIRFCREKWELHRASETAESMF